MATITTRAGKGSPLTNAEIDANFVDINNELAGKAADTHNHDGVYEASGAVAAHAADLDPHPQYATDADVDARFAALVGAAPEALDTLKELSDALGGDPDFAATVMNSLSTKVDTSDARLSNARPPTGGAGGVLSGSYPNPGFAVDMATQAELNAAVASLDAAKLNANDASVTNAREWTAETVSQAEAEAGTATTRRAWTAQRVWQAITAWWNGSADKAKLDGIAAGANNYSHPTGDGNLHVPATGTSNNGKVLKAGATAGSLSWGTLAKGDVGLANVDNTADSAKAVASAAKLTTARTINGVGFDGSANVRVPGVISCTCDTASATAAKTVTIADHTLTAGFTYAVTFTNGTSVSTPTLNINGAGAFNIRLGSTNADTVSCTVGAGGTALMHFTGSHFQLTGSLRTADATEDATMRWTNTIQVGAQVTRYKLLMEGSDGKFYPLSVGDTTANTKTPSAMTFKMGGAILYYSPTTTLAADGTTNSVYSEISQTVGTSYTLNQSSGWSNYLPVYLKGTVNSSGFFVLDTTTLTSWYTQELPTSEDGFVYILLGYMYSTTTAMRLTATHPIYHYKGGKVVLYSEGSGSNEITSTTSTNKTLAVGETCTALVAGLTLMFPPSPQAGNEVTVLVLNFTDTALNGNGEKIMGSLNNFTIDVANVSAKFKYINADLGWRLINLSNVVAAGVSPWLHSNTSTDKTLIDGEWCHVQQPGVVVKLPVGVAGRRVRVDSGDFGDAQIDPDGGTINGYSGIHRANLKNTTTEFEHDGLTWRYF